MPAPALDLTTSLRSDFWSPLTEILFSWKKNKDSHTDAQSMQYLILIC